MTAETWTLMPLALMIAALFAPPAEQLDLRTVMARMGAYVEMLGSAWPLRAESRHHRLAMNPIVPILTFAKAAGCARKTSAGVRLSSLATIEQLEVRTRNALYQFAREFLHQGQRITTTRVKELRKIDEPATAVC